MALTLPHRRLFIYHKYNNLKVRGNMKEMMEIWTASAPGMFITLLFISFNTTLLSFNILYM